MNAGPLEYIVMAAFVAALIYAVRKLGFWLASVIRR